MVDLACKEPTIMSGDQKIQNSVGCAKRQSVNVR